LEDCKAEILELKLNFADICKRISRLELVILGSNPMDENYQEPKTDTESEYNILERIVQMENHIKYLNNQNLNYFNPAATKIEQRSQELLQYIEVYGKITTTQAVRLLRVKHRASARRAMEFVSNSITDTEMRKSRSGMWILTINCSNEKGDMHVPLNFVNILSE